MDTILNNKLTSFFYGKKRWLVLLVGLVLGIGIGFLNAIGIVIFNRKADAWAEGIILVLLSLVLHSLWLEWGELRIRERRTRLLSELSISVNEQYRVDEVLNVAIANLVQIMQVDSGGIGLLDPEEETQVTIQAEFLREGMESLIGDRIYLASRKSGWASPLWRGEIVVIEDLQNAEHAVDLKKALQDEKTRSLIKAPLFSDGKLYGVLRLHSCQPRYFSEDELNFVKSATAIVATAVVKAERLSQAQRYAAHLEVADAVAQRLIEMNEISVLPQRVTDTLFKAFPSWNIYIFLQTEDKSQLLLRALSCGYHTSVERDVFSLSPGTGLVGRAYVENQVVHVQNVLADPQYIKGETETSTHAELALPICAGGEVLGVLDLQSQQTGEFSAEDISTLKRIAMDVGAALINAHLMKRTKWQSVILERLLSVAKQALLSDSLGEMLPQLCTEITKAVEAYQVRIMLIDQGGYCYYWMGSGEATSQLLPHQVRPNGVSMTVMRSGEARFINDLLREQNAINRRMIEKGFQASACLPLGGRGRRASGVLWIHFNAPHRFSSAEKEILKLFAGQAGLIIEQLSQLEISQKRLWELEATQNLSSSLRQTTAPEKMLNTLLNTALDVFDVPHGSILRPNPDGESLYFVAARGWARQVANMHLPIMGSLSGKAFLSNTPILSKNLMAEPEFSTSVSGALGQHEYAGMFAPIKDEAHTVGIIFVGCDAPRQFTTEELQLLSTFSEMAGTALRRESLRIETQEKLAQVRALHEIDHAISSSLDLHHVLNIFLDATQHQLNVTAIDILMFDSQTNMLDYWAGLGLPKLMEQVSLSLGDEYAGRVAQDRRVVRVDDLRKANLPQALQDAFQKSGKYFHSYIGLPLIAKSKVKGVLEIWNETALPSRSDWTHFLETLAEQAAIAIDNAQLFENVQRSNIELIQAYETTIEGWSRALDLRDEETEGHTQRVAILTLRLAKAMGVGQTELIHIRRGALLHDIGKIGIPDHILLKPGKLSDSEWELMRKHPTLAYELLLPIKHLRPALDIPYCHHEKWNGTGYPRGLKGKEIPLSARIFAIVDVYDALCSDRPYRKAWPKDKVFSYIREQSGIHFDPDVIETALETISNEDD